MNVTSLLVGGFFAQWIDYEHSLHAQHVCSEQSGFCRTTAHAVFVVGPETDDGRLDMLNIAPVNAAGAGEMLGYTNWEKHVVNGVCADPNFTNCTALPADARVYNWGYEVWSPFKPADALAQSISVTVDIQYKSDPLAVLPTLTIPYLTTVVSGKGNSPILSIVPNDFSTLAYQNGDEVNFHVVFSVAPVDDPTEKLTATGEYSVDAGISWHAGQDIFFEDHIDLKNDSYFQSWQFDGRWKGRSQTVCFRIVVSDSLQRQVKYENCMRVCDFVVPFHNAAGYCPNSTINAFV